MSFPQAPESGDPPPGHSPESAGAAGRRAAGQGIPGQDPWAQVPGYPHALGPGAMDPGAVAPGVWGPGPGAMGPGAGAMGPGVGMHGHAYQSPGGYSLAVATLVCGALILPSGFVMLGPAMLAMLFTRPDTGSNGNEWVANVVFYSLPALFVLLCLIFGILAVRRSVRGTSMRRISVAGLVVAAVETVLIVWPLFVGEFDAFS